MAKLGNYAHYPLPHEWYGWLEGLRPVESPQSPPPPERQLDSLGALVDALLLMVPEDRRMLVWERLGAGRTLQAVGDEFGLTRERIRQVVNKMCKRFLADKPLRAVVDHVYTGMSGSMLVIDARQARSEQVPDARPEELWRFMMEIWCTFLGHSARYQPLDDGVFLLTRDLPDQKEVKQMLKQLMNDPPRFWSAQAFEMQLEEYGLEWGKLFSAFPEIRLTRGGLYGYEGWSQVQVLVAVGEYLAQFGVQEWHFSQIGQAAAYFDKRFAEMSERNAAAILSRHDAVSFFEQSGRKGYWRLAAVGDGHSGNHSAVLAVLSASSRPMHWSEIQTSLQRDVAKGTLVALLGREEAFCAYGSGVFGVAGRNYVGGDQENTLLAELFLQRDTLILSAAEVFEAAVARGLTPESLIAWGAGHSTVFRYWKWGKGEAMFLTAAEARRRLFQRWLAAERVTLPAQEVIQQAIEEAVAVQDLETLTAIRERLQQMNKYSYSKLTSK